MNQKSKVCLLTVLCFLGVYLCVPMTAFAGVNTQDFIENLNIKGDLRVRYFARAARGRTTLISLISSIHTPEMGIFRGYIAFFSTKNGVIGFHFLSDLKNLPLFKNFAAFSP